MAVRHTPFRLTTIVCTLLALGGAVMAATPTRKPAPKPAPAQPQDSATTANQQSAAAAPAPAPDNKVLIAYRWNFSAPVQYEIATNEQLTTTTSSGPQEGTTEKHTWFTLTPAGKAEKYRVWLQMQHDRIHFKLTQNNKTIEVDTASSENPNAGPLAPAPAALQAIRGKTVRLLVAPSGKIERVEGLAELVSAARAAWTGDANTRDQLLQLLIPMTDAELVDQFSKAVLTLPVKRLEPGVASPYPIAGLSGTLVFQGTEGQGPDKVLVIKADLSAPPTTPQTNPADKMSYVRDKFDLTAAVRVTEDTGVPVRFESTSTVNYSARKPNSDSAAAPDKLIQTITKVETTIVTPSSPSQPGEQPTTGQAPGQVPPTPPPPTPPATPPAPPATPPAQPATPPAQPATPPGVQ